MVAYYFSFKTALVKGSPNVVSPNTSVLIYDVLDVNRVTPVTAYADPALTTITNLVSDQYGIVPDFYADNRPDILWKSGTFKGQWATSQSRPGIRGATGPQGPQGIQGPIGIPGLNGAGTNAEVAAYIPSSGPTRDALDARYPTKDAQAAALAGKVDKGSLVFNVKDYGALGNYTADDTPAINAALAAAATVGGTVIFPRGTYTCDNIVVPDFVKIIGEGGGPSRFTLGAYYLEGTRRSGAALRRVTGSINPLLTQSGAGSWVENFELQGNAGAAPILVHTGFQTTLKSITAIGGAGIGIDVQKANNSRWYDVEVQNCGSATLPGMRIWSKTGVGLANETNTLDIYGLTIERCANVQLDIGYNPANLADPEYWVEFVRITNLHVESSSQNAGVGTNVGNTAAAIRIGAVRSLHLSNPFMYAGPGPAIEHNQQFNRSYLNGGIKVVNGTMIGSDTSTGVGASTNLVKLINGNDFSMDSMRWARCTGSAVRAESTYGDTVAFGISNYPQAVTFDDQRAAQTGNRLTGNVLVDGHITATQAAPPTLSNGAGATGTTGLPGNTDVSGKIFFGTTATPPAAGGIVTQINFRKSWLGEKPVTITPGNLATAQLGAFFAAVSADGANLKVYTPTAPAASQGAAVYQYNYRVG